MDDNDLKEIFSGSFKKALPRMLLVLLVGVAIFYAEINEDQKKEEEFYKMQFRGKLDSIVVETNFYKYFIKNKWYIVRGSILKCSEKGNYLYKQPDSYSVFIYEKLNEPPVEITDSSFEIEE